MPVGVVGCDVQNTRDEAVDCFWEDKIELCIIEDSGKVRRHAQTGEEGDQSHEGAALAAAAYAPGKGNEASRKGVSDEGKRDGGARTAKKQSKAKPKQKRKEDNNSSPKRRCKPRTPINKSCC